MPSSAENLPTTAHDHPQPDQNLQQVKTCAACHCPLSPDSFSSPFHPDSPDANDTAIVCTQCRIRLLAVRSAAAQARDSAYAERDHRRPANLQDGRNEAAPPSQAQGSIPHVQTPSYQQYPAEPSLMMASSPSSLAAPASVLCASAAPAEASCLPHSARPALLPINTSDILPQQSSAAQHDQRRTSAVASGSKVRVRSQLSAADPLVDITRLRVRPQGHHCLYPGAIFQGTQKSGRNSYDVTVTIVNMDFASSHLCGYLRIRGLTDDWPELTTYFDAEIIGSRYGFLTRNWGASEQEDMVHWARFPAFRHVKHELQKPHLTMKDASRGAVFMRWKEKFLVPDHRVQDINGASFAGFYYVCVDFNPQQSGSQSQGAQQHPLPSEDVAELPFDDSMARKPEPAPRAQRTSSNHGRRIRSPSRGSPSNVATMSGFYFHQNSEPYQQLSLVHVPEHTTSCFEFR